MIPPVKREQKQTVTVLTDPTIGKYTATKIKKYLASSNFYDALNADSVKQEFLKKNVK